MHAGDGVRTLTDNPPHWRKGERGEIVRREIPTLQFWVDFGEDRPHQLIPCDQLDHVLWKAQIFDDVEIWVCTREEANELVRKDRSQAWRIWLFEEYGSHLMDEEDEIRAVIEQKKIKPGPYFKK